jgi:hypothetical protein
MCAGATSMTEIIFSTINPYMNVNINCFSIMNDPLERDGKLFLTFVPLTRFQSF